MTEEQLLTALCYLGQSPSKAGWFLDHVNRHGTRKGDRGYSVWRGSTVVAYVTKVPRKREYSIKYA